MTSPSNLSCQGTSGDFYFVGTAKRKPFGLPLMYKLHTYTTSSNRRKGSIVAGGPGVRENMSIILDVLPTSMGSAQRQSDWDSSTQINFP